MAENPYDAGRRISSRPERDGADIDLTVMTTNEVPGSKDRRVVDFHELILGARDERDQAGRRAALAVRTLPEGPDHAGGDQWPVVGGVHLPVSDEPVGGDPGAEKAMLMVLHRVLMKSSAQNLVIPPFLLLFSCVVFGIVIALRWSAYRLLRKLILFVVLGLLMIAYYLAVECPPCSPFGRHQDCRQGCDRGRYPRLVADDCRVHRHMPAYQKTWRAGILARAFDLIRPCSLRSSSTSRSGGSRPLRKACSRHGHGQSIRRGARLFRLPLSAFT